MHRNRSRTPRSPRECHQAGRNGRISRGRGRCLWRHDPTRARSLGGIVVPPGHLVAQATKSGVTHASSSSAFHRRHRAHFIRVRKRPRSRPGLLGADGGTSLRQGKRQLRRQRSAHGRVFQLRGGRRLCRGAPSRVLQQRLERGGQSPAKSGICGGPRLHHSPADLPHVPRPRQARGPLQRGEAGVRAGRRGREPAID